MTVVYGCTEDSGMVLTGGAIASTGESRYITANSRHSIRHNGNAPYSTLTFDATLTDFWFHMSWSSRFADEDGPIPFNFYNSTGVLVFRIDCIADTVFQAAFWNGSTFTNVGSTFILYDHPTGGAASVHEVVFRIVCGSSGSFTVYYDGAQLTTGSITSASCNNIKSAILRDSENSSTYGSYYSECIAADQALVGSVLETEIPTADGTDTGGTGTYAAVDEPQRSDVDYVALAAAGDRHSFVSPARTSTLNEVLCVIVSAVLACDVIAPTQVRCYLKIGGTRYYSAVTTLSLSAVPFNFYWNLNPVTGVAWTPTEANDASMEWGFEAYA